MNTDSSNSKRTDSFFSRFTLTEGIILGGIPFLATALTLSFESGYLSFFNIPASFISIDLPTIIRATGYIALMTALYISIVIFVTRFLDDADPIIEALVPSLGIILFFIPIFYIGNATSLRWASLIGLAALLAADTLVPPIFKDKSGETYRQRVKIRLKKERDRRISEIAVNQPHLATKLFIFPFLGIFALNSLVYGLGRDQAASNTYHFHDSANTDWVFVRNYGDQAVFARLDSGTIQLLNETRILKLADAGSPSLIRRKTGKLLPPVE